MRKLLLITMLAALGGAPAANAEYFEVNDYPSWEAEHYCEGGYPGLKNGPTVPMRNLTFKGETGRVDMEYENLTAHWRARFESGSNIYGWRSAVPAGTSVAFFTAGWAHWYAHEYREPMAVEVKRSIVVGLPPGTYSAWVTPITSSILSAPLLEWRGCMSTSVRGTFIVH